MTRFFFLASWTIAASAHASYAQMRLDGLGMLLAFALVVSYGLFVDVALLARLFRSRAALVIGSIVALVLAYFLVGQIASPSERAGFFNQFSGGSGLVVLAATSAVFLPFIFIAPFAQYLALRDERRWPRWITAWMALQVALIPAFVTLAFTDERYRKQDYAAGHAEGHQVRAGEFAALLERAKQRPERIWGTGWTYPWPPKPPADTVSGWASGVAIGVDASAPMTADEPLSESDRRALRALGSGPNIRAKLLWDTLRPGNFSARLGPESGDVALVSDDVVPVLLARLEKYGEARLCPGGRMMDADRATLHKVVLDKGRPYQMRSPWDGYLQRVEQLCPGPK